MTRARRPLLPRWLKKRLWTAAFLLFLYVFSIGPFYWDWYESKYISGHPFFAVLYEPLYRLCYAVPPLGTAVDAWVMLWIV